MPDNKTVTFDASQWQPIETAPMTGKTLLLGYPNSLGNWRTVRGQWMSAAYIEQNWDDPEDVEEGWFETAEEADDVPNCWRVKPTHWMPLPTAPSAAPTPAAQENTRAMELAQAIKEELEMRSEGCNVSATLAQIDMLASMAAAQSAGQEAVAAWLHEDGERVITAQQKAGMERDGGAGKSSVSGYSIPLRKSAAPVNGGERETLKQQANKIAELQSLLDTYVAHVAPNHPDDEAVDLFAQAMKAKMADARAKGRAGWESCDPAHLSMMLREHVEKGDPRDVANFCMMLWHHDKPIDGAVLPWGKRAADVQQVGELREAARQFHNLTQGDPEVIIRAPSAEKRDAIAAAGERLRAALTSPAKVGDEYLHLSRELIKALKRLSLAAQTSGGTAGRDDELMAAIQQAAEALSLSAVGRAIDAAEQAAEVGGGALEELYHLANEKLKSDWLEIARAALSHLARMDGGEPLTDAAIKAIADRYASFVSVGVYDETKYDCTEDFYNFCRELARAALSADVGEDKRDAERYRWAIAFEDNAETLHSIMLCHAGDDAKINERVDSYMAAAIAANQARKGE